VVTQIFKGRGCWLAFADIVKYLVALEVLLEKLLSSITVGEDGDYRAK